jgi:hypothetical protein
MVTMLDEAECVVLWLAMLRGGHGADSELRANPDNPTWRKWRRLTLRIASLIISEKMN